MIRLQIDFFTILYIFLIILIFLFVYYYNYFFIMKEDKILKKGIIDKKTCNLLIQSSKKYIFSQDEDPVDDKSENQINIYDNSISSNKIIIKELYSISKNIYDNIVLPQLNKYHSKYYDVNKLEFEWIFLRKYNNYEREQLLMHTDSNTVTVNILLSNPKDYVGGEFYFFDRKMTEKIEPYYMKYLKDSNIVKEKFIKNYKNLPIVKMDQGDMIIYFGDNHFHGVLPVKRGNRYILSFFLNLKK